MPPPRENHAAVLMSEQAPAACDPGVPDGGHDRVHRMLMASLISSLVLMMVLEARHQSRPLISPPPRRHREGAADLSQLLLSGCRGRAFSFGLILIASSTASPAIRRDDLSRCRRRDHIDLAVPPPSPRPWTPAPRLRASPPYRRRQGSSLCTPGAHPPTGRLLDARSSTAVTRWNQTTTRPDQDEDPALGSPADKYAASSPYPKSAITPSFNGPCRHVRACAHHTFSAEPTRRPFCPCCLGNPRVPTPDPCPLTNTRVRRSESTPRPSRPASNMRVPLSP